MKRSSWFIVFALGISLAAEEPAFRNAGLTVEQRVADLVSRLTVEEKAALMLYNAPAVPRLGIPEYNWWSEALHGVARAGRATVFPQAIGMAATFDPDVVRRVAAAIADEARAKFQAALRLGSHPRYGGLTFWSPNINIFRDPRWGRGQETWGEDPFLTSRLSAEFVRGLQGDDPRYLKVAACAKHFAVHSGPEPERHTFNAVAGERDLRETYLPAFKALVDAGVEAVMCAYNRTNGEPCCGSQTLLVKILRGEWGFRGHVVSDCWALDDIWARHKVVATREEAAALALKAGVNVNCGYIYQYLPEALKLGLVTEKEIDAGLKILLRTQFRLGMYDPSEGNPYAHIPEDAVDGPEHRKLAREAAVKSLVLLKNKNDVLPLRKDLKKLFVTGPNAASIDVLLGNYYGTSAKMVTILEGIIGKISAGTMVEYRQACLLDRMSDFDVGLARTSDATIAVVGLSPILEGEEGDAMLSAAGGDRKDIRLPENQIAFIRELRKENPQPLILVITGGSPVALTEVEGLADAILFAWYPGEEGGNAVADMLFGDASPGGRLPLTFYRSVSDLPPFDDYRMQNRTYRYFAGEPEFPFGYGLAYTAFSYGAVTTDKNKLNKNDILGIAFGLQNTGRLDGEEVVQVFVRKKDRQPGDPLLQLKAFRRLALPAGGTRLVQFSLRVADWSFWDEKKHAWKLFPGEYEILIGSSSQDIKRTAIVRVI